MAMHPFKSTYPAAERYLRAILGEHPVAMRWVRTLMRSFKGR
jgi:hypothetical protein